MKQLKFNFDNYCCSDFDPQFSWLIIGKSQMCISCRKVWIDKNGEMEPWLKKLQKGGELKWQEKKKQNYKTRL